MSASVLAAAATALAFAATALALAIRNGGLRARVAELEARLARATDALRLSVNRASAAQRASAEVEKRHLAELDRLYGELESCGDEAAVGAAALAGLRRMLEPPGAGAD